MLRAENQGRINGMYQSVGIVEFVLIDYLLEKEHEFAERNEQEKFIEVSNYILEFCSHTVHAINKSINDVYNESMEEGVENA